ncbi:MAG: hypothetical protein HKO92_00465 [Flavobacteriaceae bacterium]|nr:hypothetical protein [Bacteroidia bacterium]NNK81573.1 hypothetical protein [Flavobacteriaceae bacterium]
MSAVLRSISFIFHPLLMPMLGVVLFFYTSPRYLPETLVLSKLISIFLLTIVFPVLIFYFLKATRQAKTIYLHSSKERILPLIINSCVLIYIVLRIFPINEFRELHYFFVAILFSTLSCLILAILKFKASIHMIASAGILMFIIAISIHYSINLNGLIAITCILVGAIATSRLHMHAHTYPELIIGFFIGLIPQLILVSYWL